MVLTHQGDQIGQIFVICLTHGGSPSCVHLPWFNKKLITTELYQHNFAQDENTELSQIFLKLSQLLSIRLKLIENVKNCTEVAQSFKQNQTSLSA
jgi:hypothetical protein